MKKQNGDIIEFSKSKDYIMVDNSLGSGSFGKTVLIKDPFIDELFVVKKYEPDFGIDDDELSKEYEKKFYKSFLEEIKLMYKLNHPNIVRIYNYYSYEAKNTGYILMEYIDGINISEWFETYIFNTEKGLSVNDVFIQLIDAFDFLQKNNIIHRDIRESNILIDKDNQVKLIDFGIGKIYSEYSSDSDSLRSKINRNGVVLLPNEYYNKEYTSLTDMFYLAELVNRMICKNNISDFLYQSIINKMMSVEPENRYNSFSEIKKEIEHTKFINMSINANDKKIYLSFANSIYSAVSRYVGAPDFNKDTTSFVSKLEKVLSNNLFEEIIQNNEDIIESLVLSEYKYYKSEKINVSDVSRFLEWFCGLESFQKEIILSNIICKLSSIDIDYEEQELPF